MLPDCKPWRVERTFTTCSRARIRPLPSVPIHKLPSRSSKSAFTELPGNPGAVGNGCEVKVWVDGYALKTPSFRRPSHGPIPLTQMLPLLSSHARANPRPPPVLRATRLFGKSSSSEKTLLTLPSQTFA